MDRKTDKVIRLVTVVDNGRGLSAVDDRCENRDCVSIHGDGCQYVVNGSFRRLGDDFYQIGCRGGN